MPPIILTAHLKKNKVLEFLYLPACTFPKLALLSLYTHIFTPHSRPLRLVAHTTGAFLVLLLVFGMAAPYFVCWPFKYNWDKSIQGGRCADLLVVYRWLGFPNIVTDLVLVGLWGPAVMGLRVGGAKRVGLLVTFGVGNL
jgi:hypothetical protein